MRIKLIQIGNSRGIRLPKSYIEQCGMEDEVEITMDGDTLIIKPVQINPRSEWTAAFKKMHESGDDQLLDSEFSNSFDEEWEWK